LGKSASLELGAGSSSTPTRDGAGGAVSEEYNVSGRVTDTVRVRVRHPDSSGNLLIRRKMDYAPP